MNKFLLIFTILLVESLSAHAQSGERKIKQQILDRFNSEKIEPKYDKFKDQTSLFLNLLIKGDAPPFNGLTIYFGIVFDGKSLPVSKKDISFLMQAIGKAPEYNFSHSLIFLFDGQRLNLGDSSYNGIQGKRYTKKPYSMETVTFFLSIDDLNKIANSKSVEGQFGSTEFSFTASHLASLKEFYNKLVALK